MKPKVVIGIKIAGALAIGFYFGHFQTSRSWNSFFEHQVRMRASNEAHQSVRVLTYLREGRQTDALNALEILLDGELITFANHHARSTEQLEESVIRTIRVARDYRAKHPWSGSNTSVNEAVQAVLSWAE